MNTQVTGRDYGWAGFAGVVTGICLIPTVWNIGLRYSFLFIILPIASAVGLMFGLWLGKVLSRWIAVMLQLAKFAVVGVLNTAINFGVLNFASVVTGITAGVAVGGFNVPGTLLAAANSYVWNKLWVFKKIDNNGFFNDVPKFAIVTAVGLVVNSLVIVLFTSSVQPLFGLSGGVWLNIAKVIATLVAVGVNFLGYKFIVFRAASRKAW